MTIGLPGLSALGVMGAAGKPVFDITQGIVGGFVDAVTLPLKYEVNQRFRNMLPSPADMLECRINNQINKAGYDALCNFHNIAEDGNNDNPITGFSSKAWEILRKSKIPRLSLEQIVQAMLQGGIGRKEANDFLKEYGFRKDQMGVLEFLLSPKFDMGIILSSYYRGLKSDNQTWGDIRKFIGCSLDDAKRILQISRFVPPPGDIVRFAVRGVYNPQEIDMFKLKDEYDEIKEGRDWAEAQGIGMTTIKDKQGKEITRDIFLDYWMAHWQLISPQQAFEAYHRVRENRLSRFPADIGLAEAFDWPKLKTLLKAQDYVPEQRKYLAAIAYHPIGRIDLRRIFNDDIIDDKEVYEQIRDQGYNPTDAGYLRDWMVRDKDKKKKKEDDDKAKKANGKLIEQIYKAYEDGVIEEENAYNSLLTLDVDDAEARNNLRAIDIRINRARIKNYIKMVRGEFFMGLYDGLEAYGELVQGGITGVRASQYVIQWQRVLDRPRRTANIGTVISWYKDSFITVDNAIKRLTNLGLSNADTMLYIHSADVDIRRKIAIEESKRAKTELQQKKESDQLQRRIQSDIKAMQAQIRLYRGVTQLHSWYNKGIISIPEIVDTFNLIGMGQADQTRYLTEWGAING